MEEPSMKVRLLEQIEKAGYSASALCSGPGADETSPGVKA